MVEKKVEKYPLIRLSGIVLTFIMLATFGFFVYQLSKLIFIPTKYIAIVGAILFIIWLLFFLLARMRGNPALVKMLQCTLCSVISIAMVLATLIIPEYEGKLQKIFLEIPETYELTINIYALKSSGYETITDAEGEILGIQTRFDKENETIALQDLNSYMNSIHKKPFSETSEYQDIYALIDGLYNGTSNIIMLSDVYARFIADNVEYSDFNTDTVILYSVTTEVVKKHSQEKYQGDITRDSFIVAIGGVDESGSLTDVNMIATVNPTSKQILLITVPRDAYIALENDPEKMDKLTHTGWLGNDVWEMALESIIGYNIDFMVKVGFYSMIDIVDTLGGVDVYNEHAFYNKPHYITQKGVTKLVSQWFPEGNLHLDGIRTLLFCRERNALPNGDEDRNRNTAKVLTSLINKVTSIRSMEKFNNLLNVINGMVQTDFTIDDIYALIRMQLDDMAKWNVSTYSITGDHIYTYSYVLGYSSGPVWYMSVLKQDKIDQARALIERVVSGEILE